jgi:hypothetical protein
VKALAVGTVVLGTLSAGLLVTGRLPTAAPGRLAVGPPMAVVAKPPSALVVALDPADPAGSVGRARALLVATGRQGERAVVTCAGRVIGAADYPQPTTPPTAGTPTLPAHATEFQQHQYDRQVKEYERGLDTANRARAQALHAAVAAWASRLVARTDRCGSAGGGAAARGAIDVAQETFSGLDQVGAGVRGRKVLVLTGPMLATPDLSGSSLTGVSVVLPDFAGDVQQQQGWRARLQQIGADWPVVLTPGLTSDAAKVVAGGLTGTVVVPAAADALFSEVHASVVMPRVRWGRC